MTASSNPALPDPPRCGPLYKIVPRYDRGNAIPWAPVDRQDGFIHLSAAHQVRETLRKHFAGQDALVLVELDPARMNPSTVRWEVSRGGDRFPHVYGDIDAHAVTDVAAITLQGDLHVLPAHVPEPLAPGNALPSAMALRLETAEASTLLALGHAATIVAPEASPAVQVRGRSVAACFGSSAPINAIKGWGLCEAPDVAALAEAEALFGEKGASFAVELSSAAHPDALRVLAARGYQAVATENVLFRALSSPPSPPAGVVLERAELNDSVPWSTILATGFAGEDPPPDRLVALGAMTAATARTETYFIVAQGTRVGACALHFDHELALLTGSSVLPAYRGRGYQTAAIALRLQGAASLGCTHAKLDVQPDSGSHRNAHRAGFALSHTRTLFVRA